MIIKETDLFKGIDFNVMEEIYNICSVENYAKDIVLFEQGEKAECLYILEGGTVKLVIKNGGSLFYSLKEPAEVFGWSSMVEHGLYTATGVCATDLKVVRIERKKLDKIFDLYPHAGITILRRIGGIFSQRLSRAYQDLVYDRGEDTTLSYG